MARSCFAQNYVLLIEWLSMILMITTLFLIPKIGTSNWTLYLPVNLLTCQLVNLSPRYPVNLSTY